MYAIDTSASYTQEVNLLVVYQEQPITVAPGQAPAAFFCDKCGRVYKYKRGLSDHQRMECGKEKKFLCSVCLNAHFYHRKTLKRHMQLVHGVG